MADFKKHSRFSGPSKRPFDRNNSNRPAFAQRELFDAQCAKCGTKTQVPFRPNGKKPVYCANCFVKDEDRGASYDQKPSYGPKRDFAPRNHTSTFAPAPAVSDRQFQDLTRQVEAMNATLSKLATAIESMNRSSALTQEVRKYAPVTTQKPAAAPAKEKVAVKVASKAPVKSAPKVVAKPATKKVTKSAPKTAKKK